MKIRDLLDLVESNTAEPEKRVEKAFEWRHTRLLELGKWALGAAAALGAILVASMVKDELKVEQPVRVILVAFIVFCFSSGVFAIWRGSVLQRQYLASLSLLARLVPMRALIRRYRDLNRTKPRT